MKTKDQIFKDWYFNYYDQEIKRNHNGWYSCCHEFVEVDEVFFAGYTSRDEEVNKLKEILAEFYSTIELHKR